MSVIFQPDQVLYGDAAGFGQWRLTHGYEHQAMANVAATLPTPFIVPAFNIFDWRDEPELQTAWKVSHYELHQVLRQAAGGITGIDLSLVDFSDPEQWYEWHDDHAQEHVILRQQFNLV